MNTRRFAAIAIVLAACGSSASSESGPPGIGPGGPLADGGSDGAGVDAPSANGDGGSSSGPCASDTSPGTRTAVCEGFKVAYAIPASCPPEGCGLILDLHGALMTGELHDAHTELRARGVAKGFVVVQPTGNVRTYKNLTGPQWFNSDDDALIRIVEKLIVELSIDKKRVHATGFSQGGFAVLRLMCKRADLFASVAPGAAGSQGCPLEAEFVAACPFTETERPSRSIDVLYMYGRKDALIPKACALTSINAIATAFGLDAPTVLASDDAYVHKRYSSPNAVMETFEHDYEAGSSLPYNEGHCIPGSKAATGTVWDDLACTGTGAFTWGEQVAAFFESHSR